MDIRDGHQVTIDTVLGWVDETGNGVDGKTVCDLGCGVGSLSLPLAQRGAKVKRARPPRYERRSPSEERTKRQRHTHVVKG